MSDDDVILTAIGVFMVISVALWGWALITPEEGSSNINASRVQLCTAIDYVIDGDTVVVNGKNLRLRDIDAPELNTQRGERSREYVSELLESREVCIERHGTGYYGRPLVKITLPDGSDLGTTLVNRGYAEWY